MDVPTEFDIAEDYADSPDEEDLEAELLALTSNESISDKKNQKSVNKIYNLDAMVEESLQDLNSDVSSGEDEELEMEFNRLQMGQSDTPNENSDGKRELVVGTGAVPNSLLQDRLRIYKLAESSAVACGDSTRAKRYARGLKTIECLMKEAACGKIIDLNEVPPEVPIAITNTNRETTCKNETSSNEAPDLPPRKTKYVERELEEESAAPPLLQEGGSPKKKAKMENEMLSILKSRQEEYKKAALAAKKSGDLQTALNYVKIVKQFDVVISGVGNGAHVDLSAMPGPVGDFSSVSIPRKSIEDAHVQKSAPPDVFQRESQPEEEEYSYAVSMPKTMLEGLEQRLSKFIQVVESAKKEGNTLKVNRMGRIVKQYEDAINKCKNGKFVPVDDLPTPPGYPPLPTSNDGSKGAETAVNTLATPPVPPSPAYSEQLSSPASGTVPQICPIKNDGPSPSRYDKQLAALKERQMQLKRAALVAKKGGKHDEALEYLRLAKGVSPMIEAALSGLPVDLSSLPPNPGEIDNKVEGIILASNCIEGTFLDIYAKLKTDLKNQIEMCHKTRDHFRAIGDVISANRFDQLAQRCAKDADILCMAENRDAPVPNYHYEIKPFLIVQCNTDLTDNDLEITVVRGVNYNVPNPKEIDTFIKIVFPYPTENHQQYKTSTIYNTNNPMYNAMIPFQIQRNARPCQRIFKRQSIKCEVWSKGGFFRGDTLVGTVHVKLQPLETQCNIHDAFPLMEGRKEIGGKLEVKVRVRNPILKKQVESVEERWLLIDH